MITSRDRVLAAAARAEPDRVPLDFSAQPATLDRLRQALGVDSHRALLDRLHVDIVDLRGVVDPVYRGPVPYSRLRPDSVRENVWGMRTRVMATPSGAEECYCEFPLADASSEDLDTYPWPSVDWFDFTDFTARLAPWRDRALMASGASLFQHPTFLRGLENLLADMAGDPPMAERLMDRFTGFYEAYFDRMFASSPGQIDILRIADDLGMQDRLLFGPEVFDRFVAPRLARLVDMAHAHGVKVMFHSCGSIVPLVDRLIALGVDILDPLQVSAEGMDPGLLKRRFGSRLCLHGAVDTQHLLPRGSPDDVRATVRRMIDILGAGGGFILAPTHVLQSDVPLDNILALYEAGYGHDPQ